MNFLFTYMVINFSTFTQYETSHHNCTPTLHIYITQKKLKFSVNTILTRTRSTKRRKNAMEAGIKRRNECSEGDTNRRKECMQTGAPHVAFYKNKIEL